MPKIKLLAAATTAALFTAGAAFAQTDLATFSRIDANNDGQISRAEWNRYVTTDGGRPVTERRDVGAQRGYPTSPVGEPRVGGPVTAEDLRERNAAAGGGTAGATGARVGEEDATKEGARRGYPTSPIGEPKVGGPVTSDDVGRGAAGGGTVAPPPRAAGEEDETKEGARRGYPTSPIGEPKVGGPVTSDDVPRGNTK